METEKLEKALAKKRVLLLTGEITREKVISLRERILFFNSQSNEEIKLIIDSPGGEVVAALLLHDVLLLSQAPVTCIVNGECSSSGIVILQGALKRVTTKHSFFYLHPIAISFERKPIVIDEKAEEKFREKLRGAQERQKFIYEILMKKTGHSLEEIKTKEGKLMFAEEAKEFGLVDRIIKEEEAEKYKIP